MHGYMWSTLALLVHASVAIVAIRAAVRSDAYSQTQLWLQGLVAVLLPIIGALVVALIAKYALAPPDQPENPKFDPNPFSEG